MPEGWSANLDKLERERLLPRHSAEAGGERTLPALYCLDTNADQDLCGIMSYRYLITISVINFSLAQAGSVPGRSSSLQGAGRP
jgi:hypothetical protein